MTNSELTQVLFLLLLLVGLAQLLGWLFVKMRQPKVVGEILAGVVLGNALIGRLPFAARFIESARHQGNVLDFVYWLGLLLLMFLAGAKRSNFSLAMSAAKLAGLSLSAQDCRSCSDCSSLPGLSGHRCRSKRQPHLADDYPRRWRGRDLRTSCLQNLCRSQNPSHSFCAAGSERRCAGRHRSLAGPGSSHGYGGKSRPRSRAMSYHLLATVAFFVLGLTIVPRLIKRINKARFNVLEDILPPATQWLCCSPTAPSQVRST